MIDRRKFLGSSDIAAVLGISPWKTPYQLWQEKTSPEPLPEVDTPLLYWGRKMERLIIDEVQMRGVFVSGRNRRMPHYLVNYISCQVDFIYDRYPELAIAPEGEGTFGIGECKFITFHQDQWGETDTQDIPEHYKAQLYYQMAITGCEGTVYALVGGDLRKYRFEYDRELCESLIDKAQAFWLNHVLTKIPPPIQTREDAIAAMRPLCGLTLAADPEMLDEIEGLRVFRANESFYREQVKKRETELIRRIGIAATAPGVQGEDDGKIAILDDAGHKIASWNLQKRGAYSVEEQEYRVLRLHGGKNGKDQD